MSDTSTAGTSTATTNPVAPGVTTSEYGTTKLVIYMGIVSMVIGFITAGLTALQVLTPQFAWIGVALMIAGKAAALLKALGYDATRTAIKTAAINVSGATPILAPNAAAAQVFK